MVYLFATLNLCAQCGPSDCLGNNPGCKKYCDERALANADLSAWQVTLHGDTSRINNLFSSYQEYKLATNDTTGESFFRFKEEINKNDRRFLDRNISNFNESTRSYLEYNRIERPSYDSIRATPRQ